MLEVWKWMIKREEKGVQKVCSPMKKVCKRCTTRWKRCARGVQPDEKVLQEVCRRKIEVCKRFDRGEILTQLRWIVSRKRSKKIVVRWHLPIRHYFHIYFSLMWEFIVYIPFLIIIKLVLLPGTNSRFNNFKEFF